jgi:hypothetical protein
MYRNPQSPSRRHSLGRDETHLPQGVCRYLLLHPTRREYCACQGFALNRATPGSSCDCGHQACYHVAMKEERTTEGEEIEGLKKQVQRLQELLEQERDGVKHNLTARLGELEEHVDKCKAEIELEVKTAYRGIEGLWHNIAILQRHARSHDDRIDALIDANQATQDDVKALQKRVIEVDDASMLLEERLDSLTPDPAKLRLKPTSSSRPTGELTREDALNENQPIDNDIVSKSWTAHVSLLPEASRPFPFEKDTLAYKRALSRGLHRIVAIPGPDSMSFTQKISSDFAPLLRGRRWMPLVAKICDAKNLCGLPMLRQLEPSQIDEDLYDLEFLKKNCAILDVNGNILDLYIAMRNDTFSWTELHRSPPFIEGLEACWNYDAALDRGSRLDDESQIPIELLDDALDSDEKPSAGDLLRQFSPPTTRMRKKRPAAVSRTSSFGSADGDKKRFRGTPPSPPSSTGAPSRPRNCHLHESRLAEAV